MTIGERDTKILAELKEAPAFVLLMQVMKNYEAQVLAEIAVIKTESELVRATRFYQNLRCIREVLENKPEEAANALEQMRITALYDNEAGGPVDVYKRRFTVREPEDQLALDI